MAEEAQTPERQFSIERIYVKDLSFESPGAPETFFSTAKPKINIDLNHTYQSKQAMTEGLYEVVLNITVTATNGEDTKPAFVAEVAQCGLFMANGFDAQALEQLFGSYCLTILYPYAREAISDVVGKGGFPQLLISPVNFEAYANAKRAQQESNQSDQSAGSADRASN